MLSLIQTVAGKPWAIRADLAAHVHGLVVREGIGGLRHLAELKQKVHAFDDDDGAPSINSGVAVRMVGNVGVVKILGVMTQRGDVIHSAETRSTAAVAREVGMLAADTKADAILLEIDSPGGEVYGVPEAWAAIQAAGKLKPVIAHANSQMASAALYLGAAAKEIWVTPSGEAGSLGVYAMHVDESRAIDAEGVKVEFIVADESPFKTEGNPYEPLTEDARGQIKKAVNRYMAMFVRDVAKGRGVGVDQVRRDFGQGRMLGPQEAVGVKMADQVGTLEQALRRAAQLGREARQQREAAGPRAEAGGYLIITNPDGPGPYADEIAAQLSAHLPPAAWSCPGGCHPACASAEEHDLRKGGATFTPAKVSEAEDLGTV